MACIKDWESAWTQTYNYIGNMLLKPNVAQKKCIFPFGLLIKLDLELGID